MAIPVPRDTFRWIERGGVPALSCQALEPYADHLFTTRPWRLGSRGAASEDAWGDVAAALDVASDRLLRLHQVHGANIVVASLGDAAPWPRADIQVTEDEKVALTIQTADCVPLLIADPQTGAIAAAHAGWRGLAARVPSVTVAALADRFGSRPAELVCAIGPSIGACCYEVGPDVRDAFSASGFSEADVSRWFFDDPQPTALNPSMPALSQERRARHWFFDGALSARHQLEASGVPANRIQVAGLCTASHPDLFCSYRRDGPPAGRMAAAIRARSGTLG